MTPFRFFDADAIEAALDVPETIAAMREAMAATARGEVRQPPRTVMELAGEPVRHFAWMPSHAARAGLLGAKVISVFPDNRAKGRGSHQGVVLLFDDETGAVTAAFDAETVTARRTAAVTALAADLLARAGPADLTVVGAGEQARRHILSMAAVRPLGRISIFSRTFETSEGLAGWAEEATGRPARAVRTPGEGAADADIVVLASMAPEPVVHAADLRASALVCSIGTGQEAGADIYERASVVVDEARAVRALAPEARRDPAWSETWLSRARELGDLVVAGGAPTAGLRLFRSVGLGVQDLFLCAAVLRKTDAPRNP